MLRPRRSTISKVKPSDDYDRLFKLYQSIVSGNLDSFLSFNRKDILKARLTSYRRNTLHMAVWHQQEEIVRFICQDETLQSLINHTDGNGDTPVHLAVEVKNEKIYKLLIEAGGDLQAVNKQNEKPPQAMDDGRHTDECYQSVYTFTQTTTQFNTANSNTTPTLISKLVSLQTETPATRQRVNRETSITPLTVPLITVNNSRVSVSVSATGEEATDFDHHTCSVMESSAVILANKSAKESKEAFSQLVFPSNSDNGGALSKTSVNSRSSRFDSRLETRIPKDVFYGSNKIAQLPPPDSDRWLAEVDYDS